MFIRGSFPKKSSFKIDRRFSTDRAGKGTINSTVKDKLWKKEVEKQKLEIEQEVQKHNRQVAQNMDVKFGTNEPTKHVRVRYAPSPTGLMHIGGLRTALYNYLFAK